MNNQYGNVGVLDIRSSAPASFPEPFRAGNIGVILYSRATAPLLGRIQAGNIGASIECEGDVQLVQGKTVLSSESLGKLTAPLRMMVMGKLVVAPGVSAEALEKGIDFLLVSGKVLCPGELLPVIQSKARSVSGKIESYPSGFQLIERGLQLDRARLRSFREGSRLAVFGDLAIDPALPAEELRAAISGLYVKGALSVPEALVGALREILHPQSPGELSVVPEGFVVIAEEREIGRTELALWEGARLFFPGSLRIAPGVQPADCDGIAALVVCGELICPEPLLPALAKKCDRFRTRFLPFRGRILLNEGQAELSRAQLLEGTEPLSVVNDGVLSLDPALSAQELRERLHMVRNNGVIFADENQIGLLRERQQGGSGPILPRSGTGAEEGAAGNVGVLRL